MRQATAGNPFGGAQLVLKNGDPVSELRFGSSRQAALSSATGEFNANDKKELMRAITALANAVQVGDVVPQSQSAFASSAEYTKEIQDRREVLVAAYNDSTDGAWQALGASIATQIQEQRNREGFMRRVALGNTLKQGEIARAFMTAHDAMAVVATGPASVGYQIIRTKMFQPPEFEVNANLRVEQLELAQVSGDLLEDVYNQGLEAVMVQEDKLWKAAADKTVGVVNPLHYIAGNLSPMILASLRQSVAEWNLPVTTAIIANDYWADIIGSSEWAAFFDPVTKYDLALNGYLGTLIGMNLLTDAFRQPNQKVLNKGEIYVVASPENSAAYTDRGGINSTPTSGANNGNTSRGWLLSELLSFVFCNVRSCAKGKRV